MTAALQRTDLRGSLYPPEQSTILWVENAACAGHPEPDWWFAEEPVALRAAVNVCQECPVRNACLQTAMTNEVNSGWKSRHGILGGLSPKQRAKLAGRSVS